MPAPRSAGNKPDDPAPAGWVSTDTYVAETGWIDAAKIAKYAPPPSADSLVFVCGLPPMYDVLCGPRTEKARVSPRRLACRPLTRTTHGAAQACDLSFTWNVPRVVQALREGSVLQQLGYTQDMVAKM